MVSRLLAYGWITSILTLTHTIFALHQQVPLMSDDHLGIGFDFTPAYGTAAVSYANGSNIPLARVDGDSSWRNMMCNAATGSFTQDCSPTTTANSTVDTLANMIRSLRAAAEAHLGHPITAASASVPGPHVTKLDDPTIREAFRQASIDYLQIALYTYYGPPLIWPENTILAGHKLGLCHPYTSPHSCLYAGNPDLPPESYYIVGYYDNEIEVILTSKVYAAYSVHCYPYVDFTLGAEMRHHNPDESYYWEEVRKFLLSPFVPVRWNKPSKVILYGDRCEDPKLRAMIMEVLGEILTEQEMPEWIDDGLNATFVGALGAAEFAKRKPFWDSRFLTKDLMGRNVDT